MKNLLEFLFFILGVILASTAIVVIQVPAEFWDMFAVKLVLGACAAWMIVSFFIHHVFQSHGTRK